MSKVAVDNQEPEFADVVASFEPDIARQLSFLQPVSEQQIVDLYFLKYDNKYNLRSRISADTAAILEKVALSARYIPPYVAPAAPPQPGLSRKTVGKSSTAY